MDAARIAKAQSIFEELVQLPAGERVGKLDRRCAGDTELRKLVDELLSSNDRGLSQFMRSPLEGLSTGGHEAETISTTRAFERPPTRFGTYRVIREIGRGGMGVVYVAVREDDRFRKTVAIKGLKRGMDTDDILRRFELERQVLSALNHPNIARLHDAGATDDGRPFFVLEYIEGEPIDEYCDSHRLRLVERLRLFQTVCRAVHYAHQNLVVHRDLKPGNIIVTKEGVPKLLDFGIAKLLNPDLSAVGGDPTALGARPMTPQYASPEQVQAKPVTTASDVYSLGAILYELLTGHRPYRVETAVESEIIDVICNRELERPSSAITRVEHVDGVAATNGTPTTSVTIDPQSVGRVRDARVGLLQRQLRGDLDNIVIKAMRKAPQRRYASAEALAGDIENHLSGRPVTARPDTLAYRTRKFLWRQRVGVGIAAVLLLAALTSFAFALRAARAGEQLAVEEAANLGLAAAEADARAELADERRVNAELQGRAEVGERRTRTLRDVAHLFLNELDQQLQPLPGAGLGARKLVADTTLAYLRELAAEDPDDLELRRELATALDRAGDISWSLRGGHSGSRETALDRHREAFDIRLALHDAATDDPVLASELAECRLRLADLQRRDADLALEHYRGARSLLEDVEAIETEPSRRTARGLATALVGEADMLLDRDVDGALTLYEQSLDRRRRNLSRWPDDEDVQRDLAVGHHKLGAGLERAGRFSEALARHRIGLNRREQMLDASRSDPTGRMQRDVWASKYQVASCCVAMADPPLVSEATEHLLEGQRLLETLLEADAASMDRRPLRDLALNFEQLGRARHLLGESEEALRSFDRFAELAQELSTSDSSNGSYRYMLAIAHELRGGVLLETGDVREALQAWEQALTLFDELQRPRDAFRMRSKLDQIEL